MELTIYRRSKLSQDPNNTAWSKSTATFGHKILSKQGWKHGDYLGAENATHSDYYTAANASHIRVLLREDNLGLGAQIGKGNAETFGLNMLSGLLSRLNGKSDGEVKEQQDAIRNAELRAYTGQKYGFMNFVSGGFLVGDKIEPKTVVPAGRKRKGIKGTEVAELGRSEKKQKRDSGLETAPEGHGLELSEKKKKEKKRKLKGEETEGEATNDDCHATDLDDKCTAEEKKKNRNKKRRKEGQKEEKEPERGEKASKGDKKPQLEDERRARKEERRRLKAEKKQRKSSKEGSPLPQAPTQSITISSVSEGTATPPVPQTFIHRQAVRQRYIQQKRMASMYPQALKEIFMLTDSGGWGM